MRKLFFLFLLLLLPSIADATIRYASPTGGGTCSTNPDSPSSLSTGLSCTGAGDTLYLKGGTYNQTVRNIPSGTSNTNRVIIASAPGETAIIRPSFTGEGQAEMVQVTGTYITLDRLEIDATTFCNTSDGSNNAMKLQTTSHHIRISNSVIKNCRSFFPDSSPPGAGKGILLTPTSTNNEFINVEITGNLGYGIYMNSANNVVDGCNIHNNNRFGLHIFDDNSANVHDNVIRNNRITSNGDNQNCGGGCFQAGIVIIGTGHTVYNNLIYNNFGGGIQNDADNPLIANNTIYGNSNNPGIFNGSATITNNIVTGNSGGEITSSGPLTTNLTTNPGFVNAATGDFHLTSTASTAIDKGTNLGSTFTSSFYGPTRPQGAGWDIGADEFVPTNPNTRYVAQAGGLDTNDGSSATPWATIQKCASTVPANGTCIIRTGTYRETVTPASNGVTFQPDTNASVTVSGANVVTGWTVHSGNIYKSTGMNWTMGTNLNQVFVDGQMMNLARFPNMGLDVSHQTWLTADAVSPTQEPEGGTNPWTINDSALTQPNGFWNGAEVTQLSASLMTQSGVVTSYTTGHLEYTNLHNTQQRLDTTNVLYRYYLSNVLGALDTAGEWFYDGSTTLYLWTPNGDNPSSHTVEAKRRQWAFDLSNRSNITIKGMSIFAASINMNTSSSGNVLDGLNMKYVWHSGRNVPDPAIGQFDAKWGGWNTGVRLSGSNNVLKNCTIAYSSHNGVYMRGTNQTVDNCTMHDVNYMHTEGGAVSWMGDDPGASNPACDGPTVKNSTLYNSGRNMITSYYCPNLLITHNDMHNWGIDVIDCGCWYTSKGGTSGEISYNHCHDTEAIGYRFGIYMDAIPQNYTLHHNVVWNVSYGINIGEPATNVSVYNNTVWATADPYSILNAGSMSNVKVYNNLVQNGIVGSDTQNNIEYGSNHPFVDPFAANFQLRSGTSPINAGRVISGITDGYVGSAPDVGAYEFGAPAWTVGASTQPGPPPPPPATSNISPPQNFRMTIQ